MNELGRGAQHGAGCASTRGAAGEIAPRLLTAQPAGSSRSYSYPDCHHLLQSENSPRIYWQEEEDEKTASKKKKKEEKKERKDIPKANVKAGNKDDEFIWNPRSRCDTLKPLFKKINKVFIKHAWKKTGVCSNPGGY